MKRWQSGLAAAVLAAAWWAGAAPAAYGWIVGLRASGDLVASGTDATPRGGAPTASDLAEGAKLHRLSEDWSPRVAALLTAEQRAQGAALAAGDLAPPDAPPRLLSVESDLWGLSVVVIAQHGATIGTAPAAPVEDPWGGRGRRDRARAVLGLLRAQALTDAQAADLLALNLETLRAQAALADLEAGRAPPVAAAPAAGTLVPQPANPEGAP